MRAGRTGRRAAEGTGRRGLLSTEQILGQVETGVIVVDHYGDLVYANAFAADLFGYPDPASLKTMAFRKLGFDSEEMTKVENLERQACRGKEWEGTLAIRRPDGSTIFVRMNASAVRGESGEVAGTVIMAKRAMQPGPGASGQRVGLLDRIGDRLATSLQLDQTLTRVAETLVPQFADHCIIDLYHAGEGLANRGLVRRVQMNAGGWEPAPGTWWQVGDQVRYPPGHFCQAALDRGQAVLVEDVFDGTYPAPSEESMQTSRGVGMTSVIAAPLTIRGRRLGVLTLALSGLTRRETEQYGPDDRDLVAAIASRVAIAIDNAWLFEEERETALAFQNSLLPPLKPPTLDGVEVAYRYVPAKPLESLGQGIQTQVGGDWYDVLPLSSGRVGIVIGDVVGRGARAAAIMGQLRAQCRAFAQDDKAPADILTKLDDWCQSVNESKDESDLDALIVTCSFLTYDPWSRKLTIANAGHYAPLLLTGRDVRQIELEPSVLLGVQGMPGTPPYREETRNLPAGATLIFYTDGLTDRRHRVEGQGHYDDDEVFSMLSAAVSSTAKQSVKDIAFAVENAVPGQIDDDMAILVIRSSVADLESWEVRFPAEAIKVSEARRAAFDAFSNFGMDSEQAENACLLVSEVVTNVVLHTTAGPTPRHEFALASAGSGASLAPSPSPSLGRGAGPRRRVGLESLLDIADPDEIGRSEWVDAAYPGDFGGASGQEFTLQIRKGAENVWVEVFDTDLRLPRIRMAAETDEGGRGLYLVQQIASRWGSRPTENGKAVWFQMPIRASAGSLAP
jgi:PAS domain S-box-containing protein